MPDFFARNPDLLQQREELESLIIGKSAEEVARVLSSSVLEHRHLFADRMSEDEMVEGYVATLAPILQSWKDN